MKIAAVQFAPVFKDKEENLRRLTKLVDEAAQNGATLIVLPELCTTGYSFMSAEEALPFAEAIQHMHDQVPSARALHVFSDLSAELHVGIVFGLIEIDPGTQKLYNSQVYIDPNGTYDSYRKINRWGNDFLWAEDGNANPPVIESSMGKKIGLLICRDVRDKKDSEWTNFYSAGDADVVAFSSNWGDGGFPAVSWMEFATENKATFVVANRYGQETCNNFGEGGSCIIEPSGKVHCSGLVWSQDCIVMADI